MVVCVKLIESNFVTGKPQAVYKMFDANKFDINYAENKEIAHLTLYENENIVAFFPNGTWLSAEIKKEK